MSADWRDSLDFLLRTKSASYNEWLLGMLSIKYIRVIFFESLKIAWHAYVRKLISFYILLPEWVCMLYLSQEHWKKFFLDPTLQNFFCKLFFSVLRKIE